MSRAAESWAEQTEESAEIGGVVESDSLLKLSQLLQEGRVVDFIGGVNQQFRTLTESRSRAPDVGIEIGGSKENEEFAFSFMDEYAESATGDLMTWLVEGPPRRSIASLVGPAGIGKTALAGKVYDRCNSGDHFELCVWIGVFNLCEADDFLRAMVKQNTNVNEDADELPLSALIDVFQELLRSKRYMFVFDDVRNEDVPSFVKLVLPNNDRGSRIIFTTRTEITSDYTLKLEPLSDKGSWDLFCRIAFKDEIECYCPQELAPFSVEIIKICQGFPLPIVAVAGLLSTKDKTVSEWQKMVLNFRPKLIFNLLYPSVLKVLAPSFLDLPNPLRPCFLYLSIFPQDQLFPKDKLLKLWIAEGFVEEKREKTLEEVAEDYLNELIYRSLVRVSSIGLEQFCQVHRLVHNITQLKANEFKFCSIWDDKNSRFTRKSPRVSIYNVEEFSKTIEDSEARAIFLFNIGALQSSFLVTLIGKCELLTLLDLEYLPVEYLPEELGNLVHLKYLSLKNTKVRTLPKSVNKLQKLQTLNLRNTLVIELPIEIYDLKYLRHLIVSVYGNIITADSTRGVRVKEGIGRLENLQTLKIADVYHGSFALIKELTNLRQLRCLGICGLTEEIARAFCFNIQEFVHLEFLTLQSVDSYEILNLQTDDFSSLPSLRRLVLKGQLKSLPNWILGLPNLSVLCLSLSRLTDDPLIELSQLPSLVSLWLYQAYEGERLCFVKDGFQRLKRLVLSKLQRLDSMEIEDGALPLLEELRIGQNPCLNQVPLGIEHLGNLKVLTNYEMPREFVLSMQPDGGLDYWKVEHVKSVMFLYKYQERSYKLFKLGDSDLLDHLQGLHTNTDVVAQNHHDIELSFCHNEEEEEEEEEDEDEEEEEEEEEEEVSDMSCSISRSSLLSKNTAQWSFTSTFCTDDFEE